jgi:16S rRNA (cytosine1402-N4)-methyltransferase
MAAYAHGLGFGQVNGILLDLGLSSRQLEDPERGFSFSRPGPLDMRFDTSGGTSAAELINTHSETEIREILHRYGEVKNSRRIASAIMQERPIHRTEQLTDLVVRVSKKPRKGRIHPATQVYQALRIAVNGELEELEKGLAASVGLLAPGGILAVISFHSLEDRIVKHFIREMSKDCICPPEQPVCTCSHQQMLRMVTRKVVRPEDDEITRNPRSRSARLRVAQKLAGGQV